MLLDALELANGQRPELLGQLSLMIGPGHHGAIVSLVSDEPQTVDAYKARLEDIATLSHVTIEVHRCEGAH